tara:strand:+ start:873 stop:1193 length:321 start_codon:yes stop_codon:yes gene_type:complete
MADEMIQEVHCTQIQYCPQHYHDLMNALLDRSLHEFLSASSEEMVDKLEAGRPDAGLEATSAITAGAMQLFGPEAVMEMGGCPVCAFHNIIDHVTDHMAVKYRKAN